MEDDLGSKSNALNGNANPVAPAAPATHPAARSLGNYAGTAETDRTFEWGVVTATLLSVLSILPRHCARLTGFLHPKLRQINAVLITPQLITLPLRRLQCDCGVQEAFPMASGGLMLDLCPE